MIGWIRKSRQFHWLPGVSLPCQHVLVSKSCRVLMPLTCTTRVRLVHNKNNLRRCFHTYHRWVITCVNTYGRDLATILENAHGIHMLVRSRGSNGSMGFKSLPGPCITNVFATRRKNFSQWHRSFQRKLLSHWPKFLRHVAITLVIQGPDCCNAVYYQTLL